VRPTGSIIFNAGGPDVESLRKMRHTCALDAAAEGERNRHQVGRLLRVNRERIRQIENEALTKLLKRMERAALKIMRQQRKTT
jgi:DNA-directed RNA polymerase sigma subunit (sigma70/sigma32)